MNRASLETEERINCLRHLLYALIASAYPAATQMRRCHPSLSQIKLVIASTQADYEHHCRVHNTYWEFIWSLWIQISREHSLEPVFELARQINSPRRVIWVGIGVETPQFSIEDEHLLHQYSSHLQT